MTRYEAYIGQNWKEVGIANLAVARIRAFLEGPLSNNSQSFEPACAKKLIEGAIAYAEALGFAPHHGYRKARRVLSGIDASMCTEVFEYGEDGQPCYVRGPDDSDTRVDRVLAMLQNKCGPDGFKYVDPSEDDDGLAAHDELMDWLESEPDPVRSFYELSGMITAMQLCPEALSPALLVNVLWPDKPGLADLEEAQDFLNVLRDYWNSVLGLIEAAIAPSATGEETCIDVWMEDFEPGDSARLFLAMQDWTIGFIRATELWPAAWGDALSRPDLMPHWELLHCFSTVEQPGNVERIEQMAAESPPRSLTHSVSTLARALRAP